MEWGITEVHVADSFSTVGMPSTLWGIPSVLWRLFSRVGETSVQWGQL